MRPPTALSARSFPPPYPDTYNRCQRLLRKARELRRDLSVQSEGWMLGGGVVFTTRRCRTKSMNGLHRVPDLGPACACNNAKHDAWPMGEVVRPFSPQRERLIFIEA